MSLHRLTIDPRTALADASRAVGAAVQARLDAKTPRARRRAEIAYRRAAGVRNRLQAEIIEREGL